MTSGVYQIRNTVNGKCYVGSSVHIERRWRQHRTALLRRVHHSKKLQNAVGKYGVGAFEFSVIEECPQDQNTDRELYWMVQKGAVCAGYNIRSDPGSNLRSAVSEETKKKISAARLGKKHSADTKQRIGAASVGRTYTAEALGKVAAAAKLRVHSLESRVKRGVTRRATMAAKKAAAARPTPEHEVSVH